MAEHPLFIQNLAEALRVDPLAERLLLAPSHRTGRQWLDRAAEVLGGVVNVRAVTVKRLVLDLAEPVLGRNSLRPASRQEKLRLVGLALDRARGRGGDGYFSKLPPSLDLVDTILSSIEELEACRVGGKATLAKRLASPAKADELAEIMRLYATARKRNGLAGVAETHRAALGALDDPARRPVRLLIPRTLPDDLETVEREFLAAWPGEARTIIDEDEGDCPAAMAFFAADSIANEAREVLRRIQCLEIPLDRAEVVCLDQDAYIPALFAAAMEAFDSLPEELPVTFNAGVPAWHSRPGRLLAAWLQWLEEDMPAEGLARMIEDGLFADGWRETVPGVSADRLAARLRALPINGGIDDYRLCLGADKNETAGAEQWLLRTLSAIVPLDGDGTLDTTAPVAVLDAASRLVDLLRPDRSRLDAYARNGLAAEIQSWRDQADWPGFDAVGWLARLADGLKVMGLGPLPGRLYVSDAFAGGHSGRPYTFIVGLDDSRFPGSVRQDPVLLDKERVGLSSRLAVSAKRRRRREQAVAMLLARLRGQVFVSHARNEGQTSRELFPSSLFIDLVEQKGSNVGKTAALAPDQPRGNLSRRDDWLAILPEKPGHGLAKNALAPWFPGLANGAVALAARLEPTFGEFDGHVPEAGKDFAGGDLAVSPTDLELFAKCPLDFFFKRVLGVKPPDRYEPGAGRWLEGNVRGSLLHDLFQDFVSRTAEVSAPEIGKHASLLRSLLDKAIARHRRLYPPRDELAYRRETRDLRDACAIFLNYEKTLRTNGRPLYMEVALGVAGAARTEWDRDDPVTLHFAADRRIPLRGRVDRIDRLHDSGGLAIVDYKTGKSDDYAPGDPFRQGRHLQPYLYGRMLAQALSDRGTPEPVRDFAYFFPMPRDEGKIIPYSLPDLAEEGKVILCLLLEMLYQGFFPFTTDIKDVKYSDYKAVHGDCDPLAAAARAKAPSLPPWESLRAQS